MPLSKIFYILLLDFEFCKHGFYCVRIKITSSRISSTSLICMIVHIHGSGGILLKHIKLLSYTYIHRWWRNFIACKYLLIAIPVALCINYLPYVGGASFTQEISLAKSLDAHVINKISTVSIKFDAFCLPSNIIFCCAMRPSSQSLLWYWQVSVGYFISDLGMIIWFYPSLGGMEYVSTDSFVQRLLKPNTLCFPLSSILVYLFLCKHNLFDETCQLGGFH